LKHYGAERFYLWHLVDSIPLVAIPRRLEWAEPALVTSISGRLLVFAFKVAVIAPLVRLVVAFYELVEERTREQRDVLMRVPVAFPRTSRFRAVKSPATVVLVSAIAVVALLYGGLGPGTDAGRRIVSLSPAALAGTVPVIAVGALVLAAAVTAVTAAAVRAVDSWWDLVTEDATPVSVLTAVILVWVDTPLQLPPLPDVWGQELGRVATTVVVWLVVGIAAQLVWADPELPETIIALSLVLIFAGPRAPGIDFLAHHVTWTPAGFAIGRAIGAASLALTGAYLLYQVSMMPRRVWRAGQITPFDPTGDLRERLCAYLFACLQIVTAAAALLMLMQWAGVVSSTGLAPLAAPDALTAVTWHVVDALPGPDIPDVLGWRLPTDFTGRWAGLVIILAIASTLAIVAFPVTRVVLQWAKFKAPAPRHVDGLTEVPVTVLNDLDMVVAHLDTVANSEPLHRSRGSARWAWRLRPRPKAARSAQVEQRLIDLELARRALLQLLGSEAPMYRAAHQAITTAAQAYQMAGAWESGPLRSMLDIDRPGRDDSDARARTAIDAYRPMALRWEDALRPLTEAPPGGASGEPRRLRRPLATRYGYARVSAREQQPHAQYEALVAAILESNHIVIDELAGGTGPQPKLDELLATLNAGDQVVVTRLTRLARNRRHLLDLCTWFEAHQVDLIVLEQGIDTSTLVGRVFFEMMLAMAEFDRDTLIERAHHHGRLLRGQRRASPPNKT
jgi:hypothetical protein